MDNVLLLARLDLLIPLVRVANRDATLLLSDMLKECGPNERPSDSLYHARRYLGDALWSLDGLRQSVENEENDGPAT